MVGSKSWPAQRRQQNHHQYRTNASHLLVSCALGRRSDHSVSGRIGQKSEAATFTTQWRRPSASASNVRFTPKSGHWIEVEKCPLSAKSGHPPARNPGGAPLLSVEFRPCAIAGVFRRRHWARASIMRKRASAIVRKIAPKTMSTAICRQTTSMPAARYRTDCAKFTKCTDGETCIAT